MTTNPLSTAAARQAVGWRKSTRSQNSGGSCVEAVSLAELPLRYSTKHDNEPDADNTLEAPELIDVIAVRDSKLATTSDFPTLTLSHTEWAALLTNLRSKQYTAPADAEVIAKSV